jgi:hypothetical protein
MGDFNCNGTVSPTELLALQALDIAYCAGASNDMPACFMSLAQSQGFAAPPQPCGLVSPYSGGGCSSRGYGPSPIGHSKGFSNFLGCVIGALTGLKWPTGEPETSIGGCIVGIIVSERTP